MGEGRRLQCSYVTVLLRRDKKRLKIIIISSVLVLLVLLLLLVLLFTSVKPPTTQRGDSRQRTGLAFWGRRQGGQAGRQTQQLFPRGKFLLGVHCCLEELLHFLRASTFLWTTN